MTAIVAAGADRGERARTNAGRAARAFVTNDFGVILTSVQQRRDLLARSRSIAMVGASANPSRPSHGVFAYLDTLPCIAVARINPTIDPSDGIPAYRSLDAYAAEHGAPDIVNVFRKPADAALVARAAVVVGAKSIWFQLDVANAEAIRIADEAGLAVVVDRCIKVEYRRYLAELAESAASNAMTHELYD